MAVVPFSILVALTTIPCLVSAGPILDSNAIIAARDAQEKPPVVITYQQILKAAPNSSTCIGGTDECRVATQVAVAMTKSLRTYNIGNDAEVVTLISLQAFKSSDFKYNKNHTSGNSGQGTASMLSPELIHEYATSIPAIANKITGKSPDAVLALINENDDYNFGAAAWYLSTHCQEGTRMSLGNLGRAGWEGWVKGCLNTTVTPERLSSYYKACDAMGDGTKDKVGKPITCYTSGQY